MPIHCVTGTSMGSIVGGTFAAGVTPEKLQEVVLKTDWDEDLPRPAAAGGNRDPAQGGRLQDAVPARVRREGRRPRAADRRDRRRFDRGVLPRPYGAGVRHQRFREASHPVPGDGHRHRDRRIRRARPWQHRAGDARQHVGAGRARAGRDRRQAAGRRRHRQQPADRRGAQALRRRHHRRQHLDAAAEAQRDHLGAERRRTARQLPRQADGGRAAEEPHVPRRADRAGSGRHLGGEIRPLRRCHPDRRRGDAQARSTRCSATACRPNNTPRCARRRSPGRSRLRRWARSSSRGSSAPIRKCCARWSRPSRASP